MLSILNKKRVLLLLLLLFTIVLRLQYSYQTDFDSYWTHGMAESISIYGYAQWVYHPTSLIGYYPLSYPSAILFFLSFFHIATGVSMNTAVLLLGITFGILGTFSVFLLGRRIGGFWTGYLAALMFSASPQVLYYSSWITSHRFFILIIYTLMLYLGITLLSKITRTLRHGEKNIKLESKPLHIAQYISLILILFFFAVMTHRTSQLIIVVLAALVGTFVYYKILNISHWERGKKMLHFIEKRYSRPFTFYRDLAIVIAGLVALKTLDLLVRGRFMYNLKRVLQMIRDYDIPSIPDMHAYLIPIIVTLLVAFGFAVYFIIKYRKQIKGFFPKAHRKSVSLIKTDPAKFISYSLLAIATMLFILQFFGKSFYSPSLEAYEESLLFEGDNPIIQFINFFINLHTSVTPMILFSFLAAVLVFLKKQKKPHDVILMFLVAGYSSILLDKLYVRLYLTPLFTILSAMGMIWVFQKISERKRLVAIGALSCLSLILLFGFVHPIRTAITEKNSIFPFRPHYWSTGEYIDSLDCNCSTITTDEQVAGVEIFASSTVPGGSHNIYYYVNRSLLDPDPINVSQLTNLIMTGSKVRNLYYLRDWIFGGEYYVGRHARYLFSNSYFGETVKRIILDYNEKYYIHDQELEENEFYNSISPHFNRVYVNPIVDVHDLSKGRLIVWN